MTYHALLGKVHTPKEFASLVHVTPKTITVWIKERKLKAYTLGSRYFIPSSELARLKTDAMKSFGIDRQDTNPHPAVSDASTGL